MKPNTTNDQMNRGDFLRSLGMSSAALMAFYCMGTTLTACSGDSDPAPGNTGTTPPATSTGLTGNAQTSKGAINFTVDLTNADFSKLKTQGEFVKVGDVLIANTKGGSYVTLQRLCSHQSEDRVVYQLASDNFFCSAHGSSFGTDGSVKFAAGGAGQAAMKLYKTTASADGNTLTVTA
ncbi:Rieske 2Fe-2S domain-containing protein [Spirosoma utsteinense]|uniref:Cytochrome b6-f complex iron-sulfur subunit n=1 Tax=Spirosoma utsteinense TaxID=2585773 RepID=A0ABR6W6N1_9BACT|nr:Rieske 2Fe-2S domain-containing protein [Spirosoma utsteinense]MBC3785366.1 cytochrome b6-f complex iron-sulfur subunit [Spirosoma utsteinense]MBC3791607.1 cytochrome b6-f complex iron-sulfur subunit [Spirosoma utsteinense]